MTVSMDYVLVLVCAGLAAVMVFGALGASRLLAPHRPTPLKREPYECGEKTIGSGWIRFNVGYYLFALLFLVFEVEAAMLYPWAVVYQKSGLVGLVEGLLFIAILALGLAYAWRKGVLEWH